MCNAINDPKRSRLTTKNITPAKITTYGVVNNANPKYIGFISSVGSKLVAQNVLQSSGPSIGPAARYSAGGVAWYIWDSPV